jgi:signal transduction histidine kinase
VFSLTLRTKFLFSFAAISASLTCATLLVVRQRVQVRVRDEMASGLENSVITFQSLERQRESTLARSAALLAALPPLKAVMTSRDMATIQDASATFWKLIGSELFVLSDSSGKVMALHTSKPGFTAAEAQESLRRAVAGGESRDWWYGSGRLFEVFLQPIYFGPADENLPLGLLAVGYEIDDGVAADISRVAASQVAFQYGQHLVVSTVSAQQRNDLTRSIGRLAAAPGKPQEIQLGRERFLSTSVGMSSRNSNPVTLTVLKSYDEATAFLQRLNRWILAVGFAAVLAGSMLVFLVSTTFTRPLEELVAGVRALERGDYSFPLQIKGSDEVSAVTAAFHRMRLQLQESQRQVLDAERLATIGRMASTISHDLRHPLTAILAYAEFLSSADLSEDKRKDFFQEIRIAVNRMTDEISSLLGFSKQREAIRPVYGKLGEIVERAIQNVKVLPEFESIEITFSDPEECAGWLDAPKVERVLLNLLFNACEAIVPESGKIEVTARVAEHGFQIRVADSGPGIPDSIRDSLFQPFVSHGKEKGIGLGLTVVQKIMHSHGGTVSIMKTGPKGTVFELIFPNAAASEEKTHPQGAPSVMG